MTGDSVGGQARRPGGPSPQRPAAHTSNPVRIGRIGADHIHVSIRPALDNAELFALVDRLERLIGAGYDSIGVVFDGLEATDDPTRTTERNGL